MEVWSIVGDITSHEYPNESFKKYLWTGDSLKGLKKRQKDLMGDLDIEMFSITSLC
jgi:hypothetical protein